MGASSEQQLVNVQLSCKQEWGRRIISTHNEAKTEDIFFCCSAGFCKYRNISKSDMYRFRLLFKLDRYHMIFSPSLTLSLFGTADLTCCNKLCVVGFRSGI